MPAPRTLTAADVMTAAPRTCSPHSSVLEAVLVFRDADCGLVPIVEAGEALGVLTDRDVALAVADYPDLASRPVSELMSTQIVTVRPDASLETIRGTLGNEGVRRLLVVDGTGQLLGVIAWADLVPWLRVQEVGEVVADVVRQP
ncbi:MAG TPA: CBS domain-containing protein [Isosphaeraceae bacterium]|jgi:CBS domain-containing protein|nr:CBS domain-containing protein [Isosphaeraceae bacterium]